MNDEWMNDELMNDEWMDRKWMDESGEQIFEKTYTTVDKSLLKYLNGRVCMRKHCG